MATFNGAEFIDAQLNSIAEQTHRAWSLWISDDGSDDATLTKIARFQARHPDHNIQLLRGPSRGASQNFLSLLAHPDLPDTYVAFCDQDDVWMPDKLARATAALTNASPTVPTAYSCGDIATNVNLEPVAQQPRNFTSASFGNALVQNILRGNAIILNCAAVSLLREFIGSATAAEGVPFHDWWVYQVITGMDGLIILDPAPGLYYRQHNANALGANIGIKGITTRVTLLRSGVYQNWMDRNRVALCTLNKSLSPSNRITLEQFNGVRCSKGFHAIGRLFASRVRWQTRLGTAIIAIQAFRGRL